MSIKITLKKNISEKNIKNYVLFCDEKSKIMCFHKLPLFKDSHVINKCINTHKSKKEFVSFNINPEQTITLVKLKDYKVASENEKKGAQFFNYIKSNNILNSTFF